jgi:hypothetical protein
MGQTITAIAPTLSVDRIGREAAAQQLAVGEALVTSLLAWLVFGGTMQPNGEE